MNASDCSFTFLAPRFAQSYVAGAAVVSLMVTAPCSPAQETGDSSAGLPQEYAANYFIAASTISPDQRFAVIYPAQAFCFDEQSDDVKERCKDYLVALQPFKILTELKTAWPHFQGKNRGGINARWTPDSRRALVTLESRWGPGDIFLFELRDRELRRSTNLLQRSEELLARDFRKTKAERYNDNFAFVIEEDDEAPVCAFEGSERVRIRAHATTDPKRIPGVRAWEARLDAVWDIAQAKFLSAKITRLFAGARPAE